MTIVTRRTLLLPYQESFKLEFVMLNCCAKNRAMMNGPQTVSQAKESFLQMLNDETIHCMAVLDSRVREYIGHVYIEHLNSEPELGFIFDKAYWGQGYAREALQAFFPKACLDLHLDHVVANVCPDNQAAIALLSKLGFQFVCERHDGERLVSYQFRYEQPASQDRTQTTPYMATIY